MKTKQIEELIKAWKLYSPDSPLVLLTFQPPRIGVFYKKEDLEKELRKKSIQRVYTTVHCVQKKRLDILPKNILVPMQKGQGLKSEDISAYRYFFVDVDVAGLKENGEKRNATSAEHKKARQVAERAREFLKDLGFPSPIFIDSSNGFHLLYPLKLTKSKAHDTLLKTALCALSEHISEDSCKIDTVVCDRGRKIRMPGSLNNEAEPNKRMARILESPDCGFFVTEELLQKLACTGNKQLGWLGSGIEEEEERSIVDMAEEVGEYFLSDSDQVFVNIRREDNQKITFNLHSKEFKVYLRTMIRDIFKIKTLKQEVWKETLEYLEILAREKGGEITIYNRIGKDKNGIIFYDLQTPDYQSVQITSDGWTVVETPCGLFQRADLDRPQNIPEWDEHFNFLETLEELFNFSDRQELELFAIWLISCFLPGHSHPILCLTGSHGTGKSTASSMIQDLISPQQMDRSTFPKKEDDLVIRLSNRCISVFDNCGKISEGASNILCQSVTSGSYTKRKLYTDSEIVNIPLRSIVVLNSCDSVVEKEDLLSRLLQFNLRRIKKNYLTTDEELQKKYRENKPKLLGYIFGCVAAVIDMPDKKIEFVTRMASFQQTAVKICTVLLGRDSDYLTELLQKNKEDVNVQVLEANPTAVLVLHFMEHRKEWEGSVTELYDKLDFLATQLEIERRNPLYPKNASKLSMRLNSLAGILEQAGISFFVKNEGRYKKIYLKNTNATERESVDEVDVDEEFEL